MQPTQPLCAHWLAARCAQAMVRVHRRVATTVLPLALISLAASSLSAAAARRPLTAAESTSAAVRAEFPSSFSVGAGGGAELQGLASLQSTINGKHTLTSGARTSASGWRSVDVDRSAAKSSGVIAVHAVAPLFTLHRLFVAATNGRILVNDTFTCTAEDQCPLHTNHTVTFHQPMALRLNGGFDAPQLTECETNIIRGTGGNPSAVAARVTGSGGGGGLGLALLDDVLRAHGYMVNRASPTRIPKARACQTGAHPALDVVDPYLALSPGQTYTAEWAIYLIEPTVHPGQVGWTFTNRLRNDLGVNEIKLLGGATLASWETEILSAGNWSTAGCPYQDTVCVPDWDAKTLQSFLSYQGVNHPSGVVVSDILRTEEEWKRCPDNATRDYCYGSCGTTRQYSNRSAAYARSLVSSLRRADFRGKALLYLHPFISTEKGAAEKYSDDRQLKADGTQVCDYQGEYVGTLTNSYGKQLMEYISLGMDHFEFDGIYLDESSYGVTPLDYSPKRSDNHSAVIDPVTFQITGHVSFVPLVWQDLQVALYDEVVTKRGGAMIANSMPATRTVMEAGIRNNVVQFVESSAKGREFWGHAYTPVGLSKALFQLSDPDPAYANVSGRPVDNLWADLDFGTLTYPCEYWIDISD
jgi:hypothetical protein